MTEVSLEQPQKAATINVEFKMHAWPDPVKSRAAKRPIYDQIEVCVITHPGDKDTVKVFPANEIWQNLPDPETGFVRPLTYAMRFNEIYLAFKRGAAQVVSGTPLEMLPFLSLGKRLELQAIHIHTAEQLAGLEGHALKQLGMGGHHLKVQAANYLSAANSNASNEALLAQIADLRAQIATLTGSSAAPATVVATGEDDAAQLADHLAGQVLGSVLGVPTGDIGEGSPIGRQLLDPPQEFAGDGSDSAFADHSDDDLRNWLQEVTGATPSARASRKTLIKLAEEANAKLAAEKAAKDKAAA